jgi:hypothetical protein
LTYAPAAADAGVVTLNYSYKNNAGIAKTGSLNIAYRATTNDNVVGTPTPLSPLAVLTGSSTPVTVDFTTDDGDLASALSITSGLAMMPPGWTSPSNAFNCASVGAGTGCQLILNFSPTAAGSGTLTLGFSYLNDSGSAKTGTVALTYSAAP